MIMIIIIVIMIYNHPQSSWLVALSMLGKLAITSAYGTVYIFSTELFPTRWLITVMILVKDDCVDGYSDIS